MERAVIYVPRGVELDRWLLACEQWAVERGYRVTHLARDWPTAAGLAGRGEADVVIVATRGHLDQLRVPRLEIVDEAWPVVPPGQRATWLR